MPRKCVFIQNLIAQFFKKWICIFCQDRENNIKEGKYAQDLASISAFLDTQKQLQKEFHNVLKQTLALLMIPCSL